MCICIHTHKRNTTLCEIQRQMYYQKSGQIIYEIIN